MCEALPIEFRTSERQIVFKMEKAALDGSGRRGYRGAVAIVGLRHIARPEGRAHFAGDHTSARIRWMQGALHSGNRVARDVNDAL
jgi:hypothetical protein